jgi:hypothetical protein
MAIRTEAEPEAGIRRHIVTGALTLADFRAELEVVYAKPELQKLGPLWDLRNARIDMTSVEMRQIADFIGERWRPPEFARGALVVSQDFDFAMSRMLELLLEVRSSNEVMVFRDIAAAEAWLKKGRYEER